MNSRTEDRRSLAAWPLLVLLVHACGYNPSDKSRQDGASKDVKGALDVLVNRPVTPDANAEAGAVRDASGDIPRALDGMDDMLPSPVDAGIDLPAIGLDGALPGPDGAMAADTPADAPLSPDAAERDTSTTGTGGGGGGTGTAGMGGTSGPANAGPDAAVGVDAPGGAGGSSEIRIDAGAGDDARGGAGATGGSDAGSGGTTGAAGGASSTAGTSNTASGGASSGGTASGGATTGGTGGTSTGGTSSSGGSSQAGPCSGCKLLLHMDETTWQGTAGEVVDASGTGNHGTTVGDVITTDAPAKAGRAALLQGAGSISVPNASTLHAGSAFSVSAWVYPTGLDGARAPGIVSKRLAYGSGTEFAVFAWTGDHIYVDVDGETDRWSSVAILDNNTWSHVTVVFDGTAQASERVRLYLNGQLDSVHAETSSTVTPSNADISIGNLPNGGDLFIGSIDEVVFWQRALSDVEVQALYAGH